MKQTTNLKVKSDPAFETFSMKEKRGFENVGPRGVYKTASGTKYFIGDSRLAHMTAAIHEAATQLDLGINQTETAMYIYKKSRKILGARFSSAVAARVLLYMAGRELGLSQSMTRFLIPGKQKLFMKYCARLGLKQRLKSEIQIMADVNEVATMLGIQTYNKAQVHQSLAKLGTESIKNPAAWVIAYTFAVDHVRWSYKTLGTNESDLARALNIRPLMIRDYFYRAQDLLRKKNK